MISLQMGKAQTIPTDVSNLKLWLRSDSIELDNSNIIQWYDLSGNNNHAYQINPANQPTLIANSSELNNFPVVLFDGNDVLNTPDLGTQNVEIFAVLKCYAQDNKILGFGNGYWFNFYGLRPIIYLEGNNYRYFEDLQNTGVYQVHNLGFVNGDAAASETFLRINNQELDYGAAVQSSGFIVNNLLIGGGVEGLSGEIAEIIVFDEKLNNSDRSLIFDYIKNKYAPPVNLGPDIVINHSYCNPMPLNTGTHFVSYLWSTGEITPSISVTQPGTYSVEVTDIFGLTSSDTIIVSYPEIQSPNDVTFCPSQTITWSAGLGNDYNYLWSNGETTESIAISSSGDYYVTVTDSLECQITSATFHFYEDDFQATVSLGPDVNICSGNQLALVSGSNEAVQYLWNTGETSTQITVSTSGTYYVDVINANGCTASDTINVNIIGEAPVILPVLPSEICAGEIFSYSESSYTTDGSSITTRLWNFGDGNTSSSQSGEHYFTVSDTTYTVSLTIGSDSGCSNQLQHTIIVRPKPVFNFNSTGICQFNNIQFIGTTPETGFNNWNWNFGDPSSGSDNTASGQAASHTFTGSGTFNVSLMIESSFGCRDTLTKTIAIVPAPVVNFTFNDVCQGGIVSFINQSSIATPHQITSHLWNFGGSSSSTLTNPTRLYSSGGTFPVTLTVTSNNGCSNSLSKSVTIHSNPLINYTYSSSCAGLETRFSDHSTVSDGNISHVSWSFNGSPLISGTEVGFVFPGSGTHQVQQIVTSSFGCQQSSTTSITTHAQLKADFSTETGILAGTPIAFENKSIGADFYEWSIGTFYSGHETNPAVIFPVESIGQHITVKLISQNSQGCSDTAIHNYVIEEFRRDIAVTQILSDQDENGYTVFAVELRNLGTVPVTKANIYIRTNNTAPVKAMWEGQLTPGGNEVFLFPATSYQTENTEKDDFVCAEAEVTLPAYFEDDNLSNNEICKHLSKEGELILIPYPSPVTGELFIRVILSASETVELAVFDLSGKKVGQIINNQKLPKGLSVFSISTEQWNAGIYSILLRGENEVRRVKITKL